MDREALEKKAKELGIEFNEETSTEDLEKLILAKEKEVAKDNKEDDIEHLKVELKKVIKQRDDAKSDKRKLQSQLNDLETKISDLPDKTTLDSLRTEYEELKSFKTEVEKQKEEEELKNKTELERAQVQFNKQLEDLKAQLTSEVETHKAQIQEKDEALNQHKGLLSQLREASLEKDLLSAAAKNKAYNPEQIVRLTKSDFEYDDKLDTWIHLVRDEKGKIVDELKPRDYIKNFLEKEDNANLVSASVNTEGSGHRGSSLSETRIKVSADSKYDVKNKNLQREAAVRGLDTETYINILEKMDAKRITANKEQ